MTRLPRILLVVVVLTIACSSASADRDVLVFRMANESREGLFQIEAINPFDGEAFYLSNEIALSTALADTVRVDESQLGSPQLALIFNAEGARRLAVLTAANLGRQLAIVHGDEVLNAPIIRGRIQGGRVNVAFDDPDKLRSVLEEFEAAGIAVGEPVSPQPKLSTYEMEKQLLRRRNEYAQAVRSKAGNYSAADSSAVLTLVEMVSVSRSFDNDDSENEVWRVVESMWPVAAPTDWATRASILVDLLKSAVRRDDLVGAGAHASELLGLLEQHSLPPRRMGIITNWGLASLADAYTASGREADAEALCRRAVATDMNFLMPGPFERLLRTLEARQELAEVRVWCRLVLERAEELHGQSMLVEMAEEALERVGDEAE